MMLLMRFIRIAIEILLSKFRHIQTNSIQLISVDKYFTGICMYDYNFIFGEYNLLNFGN